MITTIVFDIGGVFLHQPKDLTDGMWYSLRQNPAAADEAMFGGDLWEAYKRGRMTEEEYWSALMRDLGVEMEGGWSQLCRMFERAVVLDQELVSITHQLRTQYHVHALSNAGAELERRLRHVGIDDLFETVINSHYAKMAKPDQAIYQLTCQAIHVEPQQVLFVDDKLRNTRVAEAMGMQTHVYTSADRFHRWLNKSALLPAYSDVQN